MWRKTKRKKAESRKAAESRAVRKRLREAKRRPEKHSDVLGDFGWPG